MLIFINFMQKNSTEKNLNILHKILRVVSAEIYLELHFSIY